MNEKRHGSKVGIIFHSEREKSIRNHERDKTADYHGETRER
jgi:hypothetical protein